MKINWKLFPTRLPNSLCIGEQKQLSTMEIIEINKLFASISEDISRLDVLLDQARDRRLYV